MDNKENIDDSDDRKSVSNFMNFCWFVGCSGWCFKGN